MLRDKARLTDFVIQGIFQIKYLYAEHVYGWEAEQVKHDKRSR